MKDFTHPKFPTIHIKLLNSKEHSTQLEDLLSNANDVIKFIPETSSADAKYLYGILDGTDLVGVIDLIDDYPSKQTAFIHEFFLKDSYQADNLAETLYLALEKTVQETGTTSIEIASELITLPLWDNVDFKGSTKNI